MNGPIAHGPTPLTHRLTSRGPAFPHVPPGEPARAGPGGTRRCASSSVRPWPACSAVSWSAPRPRPATAHTVTPCRSNRPAAAGDPDTAKLTGRAPGRKSVVLQKRVHGHWRDVRTVRVHHGRYRTEVDRTRKRPAVPHQRRRQQKQDPDGDGPRRDRRLRHPAAQGQRQLLGLHVRRRLHRQHARPHQVGAADGLRDRRRVERLRLLRRRPVGRVCRRRHPQPPVRKNATALPCANGLPATPYRAGMVSTYHLFSQQYGRFEARFRTTASTAPGLQESWWLWPDDRTRSRSSCGR